MLSLNQIKPYYRESLHPFDRFILREYLQFKLLEIIFASPFANKLAFLGGTCLKIVHDNQRFSEDLDFDNFNLSESDFGEVTKHIEIQLGLLGYEVELRNVNKGAYHCYIRFPGILFDEGLTGHQNEKILIQLDSESHNFHYTPDQPILNKFDVFTQINTTPKDLLLAQKFYAVLHPKKNKGRDFFDLVFLLGQVKVPNYEYLKIKTGIENGHDLKNAILEKCAQLDMKEMAKDVSPFLYSKADEKKVLLFEEYIKQTALD